MILIADLLTLGYYSKYNFKDIGEMVEVTCFQIKIVRNKKPWSQHYFILWNLKKVVKEKGILRNWRWLGMWMI